MKTLIAIFCIFVLSATCFSAIDSGKATNNATKLMHKSDAKTATAAKTFFLTSTGRYASYFRSFMPFDEDPCNHLPSRKSVC